MIYLEVVKESILDIILKSGALGIAILLVLAVLSVFALAIYISKFLSIRRAAVVDTQFTNQIRTFVSNGDINGAISLCQSKNSSVSRMIEKGLRRIGKPMKDINTAVENVGNLEVFRLEKGLSNLATISGAAPMIGFLGTVTGMIMAFKEMADTESVSPTVLAGGIYQALLTTAFGLFVGILSYLGYNHLTSLVNKVIYNMENQSMEFFDLLQDPVK